MSMTTNKPSHIAYQVQEGETAKFWTRIGAAWSHKDGQGMTLKLDAIPLDGELVLRTPKEDGQPQ